MKRQFDNRLRRSKKKEIEVDEEIFFLSEIFYTNNHFQYANKVCFIIIIIVFFLYIGNIVTYYWFYVCAEHASCHPMTFDAYARVTNPNTAISIDHQHDIMDRSKSVSSFSLVRKLQCVCVVHR